MQGWPTFIAAPLALVAPATHASVYLSIEQAQQAIFPGARFVAADLALTEAQATAIAERSGVRTRGRDQRVWQVPGAGWFIVDEVIGKHDLITYAVGLDADGTVRGIEILEYRESYGHEVRTPAWRRQFAGKSVADPLQLDQDIRNISGATLSCRHVTAGVKRLLALHEIALKRR
jgi:Na+-translocating ferredoxin:NAD+ oxidoreductase RnfG subunit